MFDGLYQSLMSFFMPYLLYSPATFQRPDGLNLDDRQQFGVLVAAAAVIASNTYILMNTYRWDWLTVLINAVSSLLLFFWTGIYTSFTASAQFYKHASEVYGTLSFWAVLLVTVVVCLLPRFAIKSVQKVFFPTDVDIIREQFTQGKFKYLDKYEAYVPPPAGGGGNSAGSDSSAVSSVVKPIEPQVRSNPTFEEDERPFYPPSIAPTATTHNPHSHFGSYGTNSTAESFEYESPQRQHWDREPQPGLTVNRKRSSATSADFQNGHLLTRIESADRTPQSPHSPLRIPTDVHAV